MPGQTEGRAGTAPLRYSLGRYQWAFLSAQMTAAASKNGKLGALLAASDPRDATILPLAAVPDRHGFTCGVASMDKALIEANPMADADYPVSRFHVLVVDGMVVAYYGIRLCLFSPAADDDRAVAAGDIAMLKLSRLAVDRRYQGQGIGALMLRDALIQSRRIGVGHGAIALCVHALTAAAQRFYRERGFSCLPQILDPLGVVARFADL